MRITLIGGGTIGRAVATALHRGGHEVTVTRRSVEKLEDLKGKGITVSSNNREAAEGADFVMIALKPYDAIAVLGDLETTLRGKTVISLAAALRISRIKSILPGSRIVRAMTNVAARVGGGYTVYSSLDLTDSDDTKIADVLQCLGDAEKVEERYMDALTAMSGSGPAYIFTIIESMVYAGLKVGLPRELALRSSYQTVLGAAKLVAEEGRPVSELRDLVTTPGGVTIDALYELENAGIRTAFMRAIEAATVKARRISDEVDRH